MMTERMSRIGAAAALAAALWVVPSVGTRGQGTLDDRFVHPDRTIVAGDDADVALARADRAVAAAVAGLSSRMP